MNIRKMFYLITFLVTTMIFVPVKGWSQPKPGTHAPIITHTFSVDKAYFGYIWKIYIEAEDPDGDMLRIASFVEQAGRASYPTDWIYLKPQYQKHFKGYIQWNTFGAYGGYLREWTLITLKVSVFDKAGNESNEVVFPFTFETGVKNPYNYQLPTPFDQRDLPRLGYIDINLYEPHSMDTVFRVVP
jgi:hypothetical protein